MEGVEAEAGGGGVGGGVLSPGCSSLIALTAQLRASSYSGLPV